MVGIVALLWFGSLALISSVAGVMLALAGFYLRRFAEPGSGGAEAGATHIDVSQQPG